MAALSIAASRALMMAYRNHGTTGGLMPQVARELDYAGYAIMTSVDERGASIRLTKDGTSLAGSHGRASVETIRRRAGESRARIAARRYGQQ